MHLPPFKLERYFARYEFNVKHLLCASDCESMSIAELLALETGAEERFTSLGLGYTESAGSPTLRRVISRIYAKIKEDQVLVHAGAEEAILLFMQAALSAGDHLIVHWPCYQSLMAVAGSMGCTISPWEARAEADWALDLDELKQLIRPGTRVIVVNTPHNPTGWLMARDQFGALMEIADQHGIVVFSDEVYRESEYDSGLRLPAACDLSADAVSLGVTSKTYGLPGLRIGWIATRNRRICRRMATLKDYTTICNSAPGEFLAELALIHRQRLIRRNVAIIQKNLDLLERFFVAHSHLFKWRRPTAGPIAFPCWRMGDVDAFCDELVRRAGVLLLPGTLYDHPGNHFRIGFGRRNLPGALFELEEYLRR